MASWPRVGTTASRLPPHPQPHTPPRQLQRNPQQLSCTHPRAHRLDPPPPAPTAVPTPSPSAAPTAGPNTTRDTQRGTHCCSNKCARRLAEVWTLTAAPTGQAPHHTRPHPPRTQSLTHSLANRLAHTAARSAAHATVPTSSPTSPRSAPQARLSDAWLRVSTQPSSVSLRPPALVELGLFPGRRLRVRRLLLFVRRLRLRDILRSW